MKLVLIYHGDVEDATGRCIGATDLPLSATGRRTMEALASDWPYPSPSALVSSSRKRAHAALAPFARRFGRLAQVDARLDEQDFGRWDGQPWAQLQDDQAGEMRSWLSHWIEQAPPDGESFEQVSRRVCGWLDEAITRHPDDALVLVSAHAGPIRALLCHALGIPLRHALLLRLASGHVSALRRLRGRFELSYFNASCFEASLFGDDLR